MYKIDNNKNVLYEKKIKKIKFKGKKKRKKDDFSPSSYQYNLQPQLIVFNFVSGNRAQRQFFFFFLTS